METLERTKDELLAINTQKLNNLQAILDKKWEDVIANSKMLQHIIAGKIDKRLFAIYMYETYHYTFHNARNQALVGVVGKDLPVQYMKFCFEHAEEETGHELMALHDIRELGVDVKNTAIPAPLMNTEILIAYLYWVSSKGNPLQRLGYSFWAENCYSYINPIIEVVKEKLQLKDTQLTFFIAHSNIDEDHAKEVQDMIVRHVKTDKDWEDIKTVMLTSLTLQERLLDGAFEEYNNLISGNESRYNFLSNLDD